MRLTHILLGVLAGSASLALAVACTTHAQSARGTDKAIVERGKYLVTVGGCNDCHTPLKMGTNGPEPDFSRMLSGHPETAPIGEATQVPEGWLENIAITGTAFSGPWGVSFAANLTPDTNRSEE